MRIAQLNPGIFPAKKVMNESTTVRGTVCILRLVCLLDDHVVDFATTSTQEEERILLVERHGPGICKK